MFFQVKKLFLVLMIAVLSSNVHADEILIVADPWCPFTCDQKSDDPGLFIELAQFLFGKKGHVVKYKTLPWKVAVSEVRQGTFSAVAGALKEDAKDFIFPDISVSDQRSCFYVRKGAAWRYSGALSFDNIVLGAANEYTYGAPVDEYIARNVRNLASIDLVSGEGVTAKLFSKLRKKSIDVLIEDENVVNYAIENKAGIREGEFSKAGCLSEKPLFIAFSPKNPKSHIYAKELNELLKEKKYQDKIEAIFKKYGLSYVRK